ncbi:MAG: class I SAM-dependent methyltransferase [Candidatus Aenigmatarchaeota archaeon]
MNKILNILKPIAYLDFFRIPAIINELNKYIKNNESILDVGCGDGKILYEFTKIKNIKPFGVDKYIKKSLIPFIKADGKKLPFDDKQFDVSLLIDVLHHTKNMKVILKEVSRVSKKVIIKDHFYETGFQRIKLKIIDFLFNVLTGTTIPFNFLVLEEWEQLFKSLGLKIVKTNKDFKINRFDVINHVFFVVE